MKTKEELNALKGEVETMSEKLRELTEEELAQVTGGSTGIETYLAALLNPPAAYNYYSTKQTPNPLAGLFK